MFKKTSRSSGYHDPEVLVGLDLGTSKITVVVAERDNSSSREAQIIGIGQHPSHGIRKGLITHLDQAARAVKEAIADAENMVGLELNDVTVSFSGGEVRSVRSQGMISLGRSARAVKQLDIARVIESAQAEISPSDNQMILHTIPVEYKLDGQDGIDDPLGMTGVRLDIDLESVIVPTATVRNVYNCVESAGLSVTGFVIKPLASALGALLPDEAEAGAVSVDIGGGTCGVAVFSDGRPKHLAVIPVGGDHVTNDVASVLKIPINKAEEMKKEVDLFSSEAHEHTEKLEFDHMGRNYSYSLAKLTEIVQCRIEELFTKLVKREMQSAGVSMLSAGMVLTGGGSRSIGIDQYLSRIMDMPVRAALPIDSNKMPPGRNGPEFTCASGIIKYALEQERDPFRYLEQSMDILKGQSKGADPRREPRDYDSQPQEAAKGKTSLIDKLINIGRELF